MKQGQQSHVSIATALQWRPRQYIHQLLFNGLCMIWNPSPKYMQCNTNTLLAQPLGANELPHPHDASAFGFDTTCSSTEQPKSPKRR